MEKTRVLIFSDTHGYLREIPYLRDLKEYDYFLYLGDGYEEVETWAQKHQLNSRFIAVSGNCDFAPALSRQKLIEINNFRIFMTHGDIYRVKHNYHHLFQKAKELDAHAAFFGHTHYADHQFIDGIHLFNPGSVIPRGRNYASVGYMELNNNEMLMLDHLTF